MNSSVAILRQCPDAPLGAILHGMNSPIPQRFFAQLQPGEEALAWIETDLDEQGRFSSCSLLLTDRRLLSEKGGQVSQWSRAGLRLDRMDHAGTGCLELKDDASLLASWRYTLGRDTSTREFAERFANRESEP